MRWQLIKYFRKNQSSVPFRVCLVPKKVLDLFFLQAFILFYFIFAWRVYYFQKKYHLGPFSLTIVFMTFDDKHFFYDAYITYYI